MTRSSEPTIAIRRVYEAPTAADGVRILVDRIWPRGVSKHAASIDHWMKELAPTTALRRWYGHAPDRWPEFQRRYARELREQGEQLARIVQLATRGRVTLVYSARDRDRNQAVVLRRVLLQAANRSPTAPE